MEGSAEDEAAGSPVARIDGSAVIADTGQAEGRIDFFAYFSLGF